MGRLPDHAIVEMGRGHLYLIPMLIAEELEVDLSRSSWSMLTKRKTLRKSPVAGVQATGNSNAITPAWQHCAKPVRSREPCSCRQRQRRWNVILPPAARQAVKCSSQTGKSINIAN